MFLSKSPHGVYYRFFRDDLGKRHAVTAKCRRKSEALRCLQQFKVQEHEPRKNLAHISLSAFAADHLEYFKSVHTPKTQRASRTAFSEFQKATGDLPLQKYEVKEIEQFLAPKTEGPIECDLRWPS